MEENIKDDKIIHEITPRFNFIYELGMPTGKKIKSTLFLMLIFIIGFIIYLVCKNNIVLNNSIVSGINIMQILNIVLIIGIIVTVIKLIIHIVLQNAQYNNIKYTFYKTHMIYEDSFLNQHRKNIQYANIKEVEIRRSVWDRILGYGIIVIYTNAENEYSNGLVIFSIKNPQEHYNIIDNLVHCNKTNIDNANEVLENDIKSDENKKEIENTDENTNKNENEDENKQTPEEFRNSLKQINK